MSRLSPFHRPPLSPSLDSNPMKTIRIMLLGLLAPLALGRYNKKEYTAVTLSDGKQ